MAKVGVRQIFDTSVIGGLVVAVVFEYIWGYIADTVQALKSAIWGAFTYRDLATLIVYVVLAWLLKGTFRKIFLYAFWFKVAFEVVQAMPFK